jgi:glucuronosyltransferase
MNFVQRWINTFHSIVQDLFHYTYHMPRQRALYYKHFPSANRSLDEMIKNSSLLLVNDHISITGARPSLPNIIEIGGIHIDRKRQLPKHIKSVLDFADTGAIVVSLGPDSLLTPEKREVFVRVFSKLPQKIIWKHEEDTLSNLPENVIVSKWLPQRDLVAHHNVRLLITHGGYLSTMESLSEGVPVLTLPLNDDHWVRPLSIGS